MSNNSNLSLTAKNISQYATIGSAFLGGLVGFFIGKSIGPSEPEIETVTESVTESVDKPISESSEPIALSSSSGDSMGFVPVSTDAKEAQQAVLQEEPVFQPQPQPQAQTEVKVEEDQVSPSLASEEAEEKPVEVVAPLSNPMASLEPTNNSNPNEIKGGKMRSTRRKTRKPRQRASRKYGGQASMIVPPS